MNPALIYCMSDDACRAYRMTAHDWWVVGGIVGGVVALMIVGMIWAAQR